MEKKVRAMIRWVPTEQGGKNRFPLHEYSTAAHFFDDEPDQDWSVILKVEKNFEGYISICDFKFLFPEKAPQKLVCVGSEFELFESRKVADGKIIEIH